VLDILPGLKPGDSRLWQEKFMVLVPDQPLGASRERRSFTEISVMALFLKQPREVFPVAIDFAGKLPAGTSLSSGTVSAVRHEDGSVQTGVVLQSPTAVISGDLALARVQAGVSGVLYKLTFLVTLNTGDVLEEEVYMKVEEL
jgi:hypothetical protein